MINKNIEKIKSKIENIPPLSPTTSQLMATIGDAHHSLSDVVTIIETDSLLTSLVLKTANSASVGANKEIESIVDAVRYLGDTVVAGLAMRSEKSKIYEEALSGYLAEPEANWSHSLKTAIAARYFAKRFSGGKVKESVAYTAGIVHDIGKTLLSDLLTEESIDLKHSLEFIDMEEECLGITHEEAGYMLATKWKLPAIISEVIRFHHTPEKSQESYKALVYCIHLADIAAMMSGTGTGIDTMRHTIDPNYIDYMDISEKELEKAYFEIQLEYNTIFQAMQSAFENQTITEDK